MIEERRSAENAALRQLVDALKEYIAARDALWTLGFFDRIFRFSRCVEMLNRYDNARENVRNAVQLVKEAAEAAAHEQAAVAAPGALVPVAEPSGRALVSMEEFEMLLGKPAILKKRP